MIVSFTHAIIYISAMKDIPQICEYLKDLSTPNMYDLGVSLGLEYHNLQKMENLPKDMLTAWLNPEDMSKNWPTWISLSSTLESIGQSSVALRIKNSLHSTGATVV